MTYRVIVTATLDARSQSDAAALIERRLKTAPPTLDHEKMPAHLDIEEMTVRDFKPRK